MTRQFVTRFLTGDLVGILIASALLTWPVCWALLSVYRRAVRRSMRRTGGAPTPERNPTPPSVPGLENRSTRSGRSDRSDAEALLRDLVSRPWRAARVYTAAAIGFGGTLAIVLSWFAEPEAPFRPVRLLLLTTTFMWPLVLTLGIVAGGVRQQRVRIAVAYAAAYVVLVVLGAVRSSTTSVSQLVTLWAMYNLPGTALVALCLSRRIRAVGPLVLLFLILGLLGADALIGIVGSSDNLMRASTDVGGRFGLGGSGTFIAVAVAGFLVFAIIGGAMLLWIGRRYERKQTSDEALTVHTMWWLFVFGYAIELAFEHPLAPMFGVVAMGVFTLITRIGFARGSADAETGHRLLLLRSFSIGPRSEHFFDAFQKHWRRVGSIEMIAGADFATRTIEPHEFLDFVTGKVSRRFIDGQSVLDRRLQEMDTRPDRDGRFRVNEFFCYDDTWRDVLVALVHDADAVLMDLRGFSRQNAGCVFEIGELFRFVSVERLVFLVDGQTDRGFLQETFEHASAVGHITGDGSTPCVLGCQDLDVTTMRQVLSAVARAVRPTLKAAG